MIDIQEKKFFSVQIKPLDRDLQKRWFLDCYEITHNGQGRQRTKIYGNINRGKTVDQRLKLAQDLIQRLNVAGVYKKEQNSVLLEALRRDGFQMRPKTVSAYLTVIRDYRRFLRSRADEYAGRETIYRYLADLHARGLNVGTIAKYRNTLYTLYQKAIRHELIKYNPVISIPALKRSPVSKQYFSPQQIQRIKTELELKQNAALYLCVKLLFYCFIRPAEIRFLKINDINLEYSFIEIRGEISKNKKTQKVVIPAQLLPDLDFIKRYPGSFYLIGSGEIPGRQPIGHKWINRRHSLILKKLQIQGRYSFYSWKHTGVVKCVQSGMNIRDLQNQLRHHSLDQVQEYLKDLGVLQSPDLRDRFPAL